MFNTVYSLIFMFERIVHEVAMVTRLTGLFLFTLSIYAVKIFTLTNTPLKVEI